MKIVFTKLTFLFLFLAVNSLFSQVGYSPRIDSLINLISIPSVSILDRQLSGDTACIIGGSTYTIVTRYYNSTSNPKAAQYIFEKFQSFGLSARYMTNSSTSVNVLAVKPGTKYPNQYFIICSHYDDMPSGTTAPGADDNASGTVGVIEAARVLSNFSMDYTIVFAAFDEEERGLYGSAAYSDSAYMHGDSIVGVINLDMISYDGNADSKHYVVTNPNSSPFADDFISAVKVYVPVLNSVKYNDLTANSDHASFWTHNWKAICSIEDENDFTPYYHTVNDKFSTLNLPFFTNMTKAAIAALTAFAADYKMQFIHSPIPTGPSTSARTATVVIKSNQKIARLTNAPRLYFKINNGSFSFVNASYNNLDTFKFTIPGQPLGTTVSYYIAAQDSLARFVCTYPAGGKGISPPGTIAPTTTFSYQVANISYACIGSGTTSSNYPFTTYWEDGRTNLLFLASEMIAGGASTGYITKIGFNIIAADPAPMNGFNVRFQMTSNTSISAFTSTGWTTSYTGTYTVPGVGWQYINLTTPFYWTNNQNLLVEICYNNSNYTSYSTVNATPATGMMVGYYTDLPTGDGCTASWTATVLSYRANTCFEMTPVNSIVNISGIPKEYKLSQNYPNPFNPVTKIDFAIPKTGFVTLKVFDILGREVANLVNVNKSPGFYSVDFNASDLSSGVYFYKLTSGNFTDIKKLTVIK